MRNPAALPLPAPIADPRGLVMHSWTGGFPGDPWFTLQWQVGGVGAGGEWECA